MYWSPTASKALIWLLAALLPLQGLHIASCCCAAQVKVTAADAGASKHHATCCCCRERVSLPADPQPATHSCCRRADSHVKQTCCRCSAGCQCKKNDSSPRPKQIPPEHRTQINDLTTGPLVIFCLESGDPQTMEMEDLKVTSLSGADRCVLLCRFHL